MPPELIVGLFNVFAPIVKDIIEKRKAAGDASPTDAQITADFQANITKYLGEGAAWKASHPVKP